MTVRARTLLIFAHPALERARLNPAMIAAVQDLPDLSVRDLYELYPDFAVDVPAEQRALMEHDLIVLQFPFYWYSTPSLLKEWLDLVFLHGFAYGDRGRCLQGKTLLCAVSTGGPGPSYAADGHNLHSLDDYLLPWSQTAALCRMRWAPPFAVHAAALIDADKLARETGRYRDHLVALATAAPRAEVPA